jgi:outer membrane protein TolC
LRGGTWRAAALLCCLAGCTAEHYRESADTEVYALLKDKEQTVFGVQRPFSLEQYEGQPAPTAEVMRLNLRDALRLASRHSRPFQSQRETLYLVALTLTGDRHVYAPQFLASLQAAVSGSKEQSQGSVDTDLGVSKAWTWGLLSAVRFSTSLLRTFTSNPTEVARSALSFSLSQPLLRGFGTNIAAENLTQSERNVIYAVRDFERFRREFAVSTTSSYLRALQLYDNLANAEANLESTRTNFERIQAQAEWGLIPFYQVDQAKTSVLSSEENLNRSQKALKDGLDSFKLLLGLPLDQEIELDTSELAALKTGGFGELGIDVGEAAEIALACRLDLANEREGVEDAERTVVIAADDLQAQLDVVGDLTIPTEEDKPFKLQTEKFVYSAGINLDLPVERTRERNQYRAALITLDRRRRTFEETVERTRLEVVEAFRGLERALRSYEIQESSLAVATQRVESTQALLEWGRVQTRDLLDSIAAELSAKNALTGALIDYRLAYLDFLLALDVLEVDEEGMYSDLAAEEIRERTKANG